MHGGVKETVIPEFKTDAEFINWAFQQQAEALTNLAKRLESMELALQKIPPPGADMIKYKIPGQEEYSNLKIINHSIISIFETILCSVYNLNL